jgi:hypothetical protein
MKLLNTIMKIFKYNHSYGMIKIFSPTTLVVRNAPILYRKDIKYILRPRLQCLVWNAPIRLE